MKQIYIKTKIQSQSHLGIGNDLAIDYQGVSLCKGPPGRTRIPVTAYCLNPGNLEAPLPDLVEGSIIATINYNYLNKNENQSSTNI